jgi:CheY-like chemotaxis protein
MPRLDGIAATRTLLQRYPGLKIIALSMYEEDDLIVEMLYGGRISDKDTGKDGCEEHGRCRHFRPETSAYWRR